MIGIGTLARRTGSKVQTIRYYEGLGLMPEPQRTEGNQRRYDERHVRRLSFIRHARALGFSLEAIAELLRLAAHPEQPCAAADRIAAAALAEVDDRLAKLTALRRELVRMVEACDRGTIAECRVIESLADHAYCETEHA